MSGGRINEAEAFGTPWVRGRPERGWRPVTVGYCSKQCKREKLDVGGWDQDEDNVGISGRGLGMICTYGRRWGKLLRRLRLLDDICFVENSMQLKGKVSSVLICCCLQGGTAAKSRQASQSASQARGLPHAKIIEAERPRATAIPCYSIRHQNHATEDLLTIYPFAKTSKAHQARGKTPQQTL